MSVRALRDVTGPAGRIEVRVDEPAGEARAIAVIAPPHPQLGGTLHDRVVFHTTAGLRRLGCAVWRFNFRGVGTSEGAFDNGVGELADMRAVLDHAVSASTADAEVWAIGYSFGAWVATEVGAADPRVSTMVAIAPPVNGYELTGLRGSDKPKFLIHGEFDELTPLKAVRQLYASLSEPRELVVIDGADHVFDGHASELAEAIEDLLG
jgi:alpha/beta superfamily hydrolase